MKVQRVGLLLMDDVFYDFIRISPHTWFGGMKGGSVLVIPIREHIFIGAGGGNDIH